MKKKYYLEWVNKDGRWYMKSIGKDCPSEAIKLMQNKIKSKSCASVYINWNYVGDDVPNDEIGKDYFYKGLSKTKLEIFGHDVYIDNDIQEM